MVTRIVSEELPHGVNSVCVKNEEEIVVIVNKDLGVDKTGIIKNIRNRWLNGELKMIKIQEQPIRQIVTQRVTNISEDKITQEVVQTVDQKVYKPIEQIITQIVICVAED